MIWCIKLVKRRLLSLAASRILSSLFNAYPCFCAQVAVSFSEFPLVIVLPSGASATAYPILFGALFGTITMSDFSLVYMSGVRPQTFPNRSTGLLPLTDTNEISRFSNIERPRMHRFLDSAGSVGGSLYNAVHRVALPFGPIGRHPKRVISELNSWPTFSPVNASRATSRSPAHDSGP